VNEFLEGLGNFGRMWAVQSQFTTREMGADTNMRYQYEISQKWLSLKTQFRNLLLLLVTKTKRKKSEKTSKFIDFFACKIACFLEFWIAKSYQNDNFYQGFCLAVRFQDGHPQSTP
jgi:hypothetical protein